MARSTNKTRKQTKARQRVTCSCGCGKKVSPPTKRWHLKGLATVDVRATTINMMPQLPHTLQPHLSSNPRSQAKRLTQQRTEECRDKISTITIGEDINIEDLPAARPPSPIPIEGAESTQSPPLSTDEDTETPAPLSEPVIAWSREERMKSIAQQRWGRCRRCQNVSIDTDTEEEAGDSGLDEDPNILEYGRDSESVENEHPGEEVPTEDPDDSFFRQAFQREAAQEALGGKVLHEAELSLLRLYTLKVEDHLTERTYSRLFKACPTSEIKSLKQTKRYVQRLSGITPVRYSCCIDSCVCFAGPYKDLDCCPNPKCNQPCFKADGQPRKYFDYLPLIPRLKAMVSNPKIAQTMRYRSQHKHTPRVTKDIFDGTHYQSLLNRIVPSSHPPFFFFSDPRDIALGISTDGFGPHKRRDKTCWPIILFNYNLPPDIRFHKEYCIDIGTIPGPKKPWDTDSFLWALMQELIQLEIGIEALDGLTMTFFVLHCYLLLGFGDIPAMSLLLRMKGQNGLRPCRLCDIVGIAVERTHYIPLRRHKIPGKHTSYDPSNLHLRTHKEFIQQAKEVNMAPTATANDSLAKQYGIKGYPILANLSALSLPTSFPFDFMHLIWENVMKNLISFWTGEFKDLDHSGKGYLIAKSVWEKIDEETAACRATIPSSFGALPTQISTKRSQVTAEMYANWTLFVAPVVLRGRFPQMKYYNHFMDLVELLRKCLSYEISDDILEDIEEGFRKWVLDYERIYYEYKPERLSSCPLTIHALLHIAHSIRTMGPVWAYWAWPMERRCEGLLPAIRSVRHPYVSISVYITAIAQLNQIRMKYHVGEELNLDPDKPKEEKGSFTHPEYPLYKLTPVHREAVLDKRLRKQIWRCLATCFDVMVDVVKQVVKLDTPISQYGRVTRLEGGDRMYARDLVKEWEDSRDASYVRYHLYVDRHAHNKKRKPEFYGKDFFGQLLRTYVITIPPTKRLKLKEPTTLILALIRGVKAWLEKNNIYYYKQDNSEEVVDISTVKCVVGRIKTHNGEWAIIDRHNIAGINVD